MKEHPPDRSHSTEKLVDEKLHSNKNIKISTQQFRHLSEAKSNPDRFKHTVISPPCLCYFPHSPYADGLHLALFILESPKTSQTLPNYPLSG